MIAVFFISIRLKPYLKINILASILHIYIIWIFIFSFFWFFPIKLLVGILIIESVLSLIKVFTLKLRKYLFTRTLIISERPFLRLLLSLICKYNRVLLLKRVWFFKRSRGRVIHFVVVTGILTICFV